MSADVLATAAVEYAEHHWPVFPLRGKVPAIPNPHPQGSPERLSCKGECGQYGHGLFDATTDAAVVITWWSGRYARANIGVRVPESMIVIDIDPRHGGDETLAALEAKHGKLPDTLTTISGRGDGGRHLYFRRPPGKLSARRLGPGIDVKTHLGYVVGAPSIHPETGQPYTRIDRPVAAPPGWLIELLGPEPTAVAHRAQRHLRLAHTGSSIADEFGAATSWADILEPHGWRCLDDAPDADGARWVHPTATSSYSATVRHGCLFVYSTNTVFGITEQSYPKGYTRFRAYALLNHAGDLRAAARSLSEGATR